MALVHHLGFPDISSVAAKRCLFGERAERNMKYMTGCKIKHLVNQELGF